MSATSPATTPPVLALASEYSTPYAALVRDEVVMGVPRYFLERWLPVLGPAPAALVNTLRQLDYRCQGDAITISGAALAREAGMSRRHLYTCLEHPWIGAFVRAISGQKARDAEGKIWQQANRYAVRMDDPLAPGDAARLLALLPTLADNPLQAAARAIGLEPRALWAEQPGADHPAFAPPAAITARDVLLRAFPGWNPQDADSQTAFNQLAEALHRHITLGRDDGRTSKVIVPQYFRRRWWPRLGHDLAWAYLWLRGNVYDRPDEGIQRDTCWVPALDTLLTLLGRPREWWRRNVEQARPHSDGWALSDFFTQIEARKGRDPAHPQWVARCFRVALEIPIAPEDRARYAELLRDWPADGIPPGSATYEHTGTEGVRHIETHRLDPGPPQTHTPDLATSATSEHTGSGGVRHIETQGSATPAHRESESNSPAPNSPQATEASSKPQPAPPPDMPAAAVQAEHKETLRDWLRRTYRVAPATPLYAAAPARVWLEQSWSEPVRPHTPAWTLVQRGTLHPRDLVALILAVSVDRTVQEPPRYLSWLAQRWSADPAQPPVERWDEWRRLAAMPLSGWLDEGRGAWLTLAPRDNRALPFGLDDLAPDDPAPPAVPPAKPRAEAAPAPDPPSSGLDQRPGGGLLTVADMWRATLGQLSLQLNQVTYQSWVEGTRAVAFDGGVLTVQARSSAARDWLETRLGPVIERVLSGMAGQPVRVRYTRQGDPPGG